MMYNAFHFRKEQNFDLYKFVNEIKKERAIEPERKSGEGRDFETIGFSILYFACCQKPKKSERIVQLVDTLLDLGAGT